MRIGKRPGQTGFVFGSPALADARHGGLAAGRRRGKRNPWVVALFFGLVVMSWINSQM